MKQIKFPLNYNVSWHIQKDTHFNFSLYLSTLSFPYCISLELLTKYLYEGPSAHACKRKQKNKPINMSHIEENKCRNDSRPLLDDNRNIKRKTIDEHDESYMTNDSLHIYEGKPTFQKRCKSPITANEETIYIPTSNEGVCNLNDENQQIQNDAVVINIKGVQHYQQYRPQDDRIAQNSESPLSEQQKKQLTLLYRKNPSHPRRFQIHTKKELHKEMSEGENLSYEENKNTRHESPFRNENISEQINDTRIARNTFTESVEDVEHVRHIQNAGIARQPNDSRSFSNGEAKISTHNKEYRQLQEESLLPIYKQDNVKNRNRQIKQAGNENCQINYSQGGVMDVVNAKNTEYKTALLGHEKNSTKNMCADSYVISNHLDDRKNMRIVKNVNKRNEALHISMDSVNNKKGNGLHDNSDVFVDEETDTNKEGTNFSGYLKTGIASSDKLEDNFQNKRQLETMRSNSPTKTNEQGNVGRVSSKDDYITQNKSNMYQRKEYERLTKVDDSSATDLYKGHRQNKKIEIHLDRDTSKHELTNLNYTENYETIPIYKKHLQKGELSETQEDDAEETPKLKKEEKLEIKITNNKQKVEPLTSAKNETHVVEEIEEKKSAYVNYDDIPCRGMKESYETVILSNEFNMTYRSEQPPTNRDVAAKRAIRIVSSKRNDSSIHSNSYSIGTSNMSNITIQSNSRNNNENSISINSSYNQVDDKKNEQEEGEKRTLVSVEKRNPSKWKGNSSSSKSTPTRMRQASSTNKKTSVAQVTSKIKADNVSYMTYDELTEFPHALTTERISDMLEDIIEKSKHHDWTKQIEDLIILRRIMKYHTKIFFKELAKDLRRVVRTVVELINSPRSCVSKNALLCLSEFYNTGKKQTDCTIDDTLLPCLKKAHQTSVDFISNAANNALLAICNACSENKLILYFMKQINSKQKTYNLLCLRCLIAVLIKLDHNIIKFKEAEKLVEMILECTVVGSAEMKCTARVALVVLENVCPIKKLCGKNISAALMEQIDGIIDKTSENEIDLVLGKIAVC